MRRALATVFSTVTMILVAAGAASAGPIIWTDWTFAVQGDPGAASGTLGGVNVSYAGDVAASTQIAGGANYWSPDTPYLSSTVSNAPPCCDIITLDSATAPTALPNKLTFSTPLVNPILAIVSLGQTGLTVDYNFDQSFTILSTGTGFFGGGPNSLTNPSGNILHGVEGHGAIQFTGTFSSISWTTSADEYWHGFQVGVAADAVPDAGSTMLLFSTAAGLLAIVRRAKKQ